MFSILLMNRGSEITFFEVPELIKQSRKKKKSNMIRIGPPTHPGEMLLEEFLKPLVISQVDLAAKLAVSYVRINELI
jgi:cytochrome c-type biogenesis protein CcmE